MIYGFKAGGVIPPVLKALYKYFIRRCSMPTFNQLVRNGRETIVKKAKAPALLKGFNSMKRQPTDQESPQKRGV